MKYTISESINLNTTVKPKENFPFQINFILFDNMTFKK
jgi:hypothetical protein